MEHRDGFGRERERCEYGRREKILSHSVPPLVTVRCENVRGMHVVGGDRYTPKSHSLSYPTGLDGGCGCCVLVVRMAQSKKKDHH